MIRIAIADDHPIVTEGISEFLKKHEGLSVVYTANNGEDLLAFLATHPVDVVLMDINMPKRDGISSTSIIKSKYPHTKVIIFTMYNENTYYKLLLEAGADGYVLKTKGKEELISAIHKVIQNQKYFAGISMEKNPRSESKLSDREIEIVRLLLQGMKITEIAEVLHISGLTVRTHQKNIYRKLQINSIKELASYALNEGLLK